MKSSSFGLGYILLFLLKFNLSAQEGHLSLFYDFDGEDFDYSVAGMVGTNDSLYVISNTPNYQGMFFRLNDNGKGFTTIWEFDSDFSMPSSILGNDTIIYITTRASVNGGGALFEYSLKNYEFKLVRDFTPFEAQEIQIKNVTDTLLWLSSSVSFSDKGSIFTIEKDGTGFTKVYRHTSYSTGATPADFVIHDKKIYIACYNGGGIPYYDSGGSLNLSGSIIRVNLDGSGYENLIKGGDAKGTQPNTLCIRNDKLYGLFSYSGSTAATGGQFFKSNLDGTSYDSLGALDYRALSMVTTDSLFYGISTFEIFGVDPFTGDIRFFKDLDSNPDFGYDVVSKPTELKKNVFFACQQGGPNRGGTILKWKNRKPDLNLPSNARMERENNDAITLSNYFSDPDNDPLSFYLEYNSSEVQAMIVNNAQLYVNPKIASKSIVKVIATDGWTGYNSHEFEFDFTDFVLSTESQPSSYLLPNPTNGKLTLSSGNFEQIEIITNEGKVLKKFMTNSNNIDITELPNGIYFVRYKLGENTYLDRIIKK